MARARSAQRARNGRVGDHDQGGGRKRGLSLRVGCWFPHPSVGAGYVVDLYGGISFGRLQVGQFAAWTTIDMIVGESYSSSAPHALTLLGAGPRLKLRFLLSPSVELGPVLSAGVGLVVRGNVVLSHNDDDDLDEQVCPSQQVGLEPGDSSGSPACHDTLVPIGVFPAEMLALVAVVLGFPRGRVARGAEK